MSGGARPIGPLAVLWLVLVMPARGAGEASAGFVRLADGRFRHGAADLTLRAASCYPYWEYRGRVWHGAAWAVPEFPVYIRYILDLGRQVGVNTFRVTDILDGARDDWRNPVVWSNLDTFVREAEARGSYVILTASVYRKWLIARGRDPYDPGLWSEFLAFFGGRYQNARNVLYIGIAGEVPPPTAKPKPGPGARLRNPTAAEYMAFFTRTLADLKRADPNHLLCVGGLSFLNRESYGIPWRELFSLPGNSLAAIHAYSEGDLTVTLPLVSGWAAERGMPWVLEEFGARQALGDRERAAYFTRVFAAARVHGAAGVGLWNLGPESATTSYEIGPQTPLAFAAVREAFAPEPSKP